MDRSETSPDFAAVSSDEMGFALSLFVEAANQHIPAHAAVHTWQQSEDQETCHALYVALSADVPALPEARLEVGPEQETTLLRAFQVLCSYYVDAPQQAAICARVLAFYLMMEKSGGSEMEPWMQRSGDDPETVRLHPAVVDTMASVRLHGTVVLSARLFAGEVERMEDRSRQTSSEERPF